MQFGLKVNCRTTDNIFILNSLILKQIARKKPPYVCFVDFSKAFDYINRHILYYKLIKSGINGKLLNIIMNMVSKANCRVRRKGKIGKVINSEFGVLQWGMPSPEMSKMFLADLYKHLKTEVGVHLSTAIITYILYADDLILVSDSVGLQKLLDGLFSFCKKWHDC